MQQTLQRILTAVAMDKKLENPEQWVEQCLTHCEVHSDYNNFIHLKSNKKMWFGVRDSQFECQPFVLYREFTVSEENIKEFEIYTFKSIEDPRFHELIKEAYQSYFDSIKDLRVYYELEPVNFSVKFGDTVLSLGEYNDMDVDFDFETDLYHLEIVGSNINMFTLYKERLELTILGLMPYFKEVAEGVYTSDIVCVTKLGKPVPFVVVRHDEEWAVNWK